MLLKDNFRLLTILLLIFLNIFKKVKAEQGNDFNKYYFTMYPSKNRENPYLLFVNTPFQSN